MTITAPLFAPLTLPCGVTLKNRIAKSAMSDSLGDGRGNPTLTQIRLYERWARGGVAVAIIGEVQGDPRAAEKPGNLVLGPQSDEPLLRELARRGQANDTLLWLQLGHAGAMTHPPIGEPRGPSVLDLPDLVCRALSLSEITALPDQFARTAAHAQALGFSGVQIHAAHGFLLSQFLSPLFNKRSDAYGGSLVNRMRLLLEVIDAVRDAVGPDFPVALKLNATDQLEGGFDKDEALEVIRVLDQTSLDLIDISGGTYFPGAKSASDSAGGGPYFTDFGKAARKQTSKPLMITGGFKTAAQAVQAVRDGAADIVGLARALVLAPDLPHRWARADKDIEFPRFTETPEGGVTAWYMQALTQIGQDAPIDESRDVPKALAEYNARDAARVALWNTHFG
ncbi:NADH:flavin oxidoreductase/NADH oxidase family protein [Cognatiyoonia sp. IB215182]|uniref:NADH:flavin oxidoreductase/NADH oxidase family protein n=1 Tax=Cognatiyoonia sp. IB215182 TaxID=3097353 RepID=UPI002A154102|nr:NADH:flavin oxidoreductase/NADH oxidase family protein [Cognatiyoonia sp. IB215182]MDX8352602.1 NADH:flavin oxidoreductase/NADH oxidase family protein [Cognatiyoonia sp. IB215182]